ncbi:hypothetical protein ABZ502_30195 [Streptomyces abikoensis]|uniref:hypothetical protein n=1 Tax=Streptomyces abikoensis TaxID=97398 RepID=UPI0033D34E3C
MDAESTAINAFSDSLRKRWERQRQLRTHGENLDEGVVQAISDDAAALVISNLSWHLALGESVSARSLATKLGLAAEAIIYMIESGHFVGLVGKHDAFLPLWQFSNHTPDKEPSDAVAAVLRVFRDGLGKDFAPELVVLWGATKQPELHGEEPRQVLLSNKDPQNLTWSAQVTVSGLTQ